jgi:hypothetical protein
VVIRGIRRAQTALNAVNDCPGDVERPMRLFDHLKYCGIRHAVIYTCQVSDSGESLGSNFLGRFKIIFDLEPGTAFGQLSLNSPDECVIVVAVSGDPAVRSPC